MQEVAFNLRCVFNFSPELFMFRCHQYFASLFEIYSRTSIAFVRF